MADVRITKVAPGPLDPDDLRAFQGAFGIQADGRFGAQSMAQVDELRLAWGRTLDELKTARKRRFPVLLLAAALGAIAGSLF